MARSCPPSVSIRWMNTSSSPERICCHSYGARAERRDRLLERGRIVAADVQRRCRRRPPAARRAARAVARPAASRSGPLTDQVVRLHVVDDFRDGAVGEQFAVGDVGQPMAALGFIHVVRGDQEGQPLRRRAGESPPRNRAAPWDRRRRSARRAGAASAGESGTRPARAAASSRRKAGRRAAAAARKPELLDAVAAPPRGGLGTPYMRATKSRFSAMLRSSQKLNRCVM